MRNNNRTNRAPKPVTKTIQILIDGRDSTGREYDVDSFWAIMSDLEKADCFGKLSIFAVAERKMITGNDTDKGTMNIARIQSIDISKSMIDLVLFGRNVDKVGLVNYCIVIPKVRTDKAGNVLGILSFDIVKLPEPVASSEV